jgi:hypothetical protein
LVVPHVLPYRLIGNHYRDFLSHDLRKLLEDAPLAVTARIWYLHYAVLCEMFTITPVITEEKAEGEHCIASTLTRIESSGILPVGTPKTLSMRLLLTTEGHFTIALRMPVTLTATAPASREAAGHDEKAEAWIKFHGGDFEHLL